MGKEKHLLLIALSILIISSISSLYVYATTDTSERITINNTSYHIEELFLYGKQKTITVNDEIFSGVAFDEMIKNIGIIQPEKHRYTIIGADNYQKTVTWDNLQHGILTRDRTSIFSDLPKAFHIKEIVSIEVN